MFTPGVSGNPAGKKPGTRNRTSRVLEPKPVDRAGRYCARLNWFGDRWLFASSTVLFDPRDKALPSRAQPPAAGGAAVVFEQDPRAWFAVFEIHAAPVFVRDDARCRDVVAVGKRGGQVRGAVDGGGLTGAVAELADFDADALAVARPAVVGMIALLGREQVLDNFTIIHGEMPCHPTGASQPRVFLAPLAFHEQVVGVSRRGDVHVCRRMDGDVTRLHRSADEASMNVGRQQRHADARQIGWLGSQNGAGREKHRDACKQGKASELSAHDWMDADAEVKAPCACVRTRIIRA